MKEYLLPFIFYVFTIPIVQLFASSYLAYAIHVLIALSFIFFYWKKYKLKFKPDLLALLFGLAIAALWIGLENLYPLIHEITYVPSTAFLLTIKLAGFLIAAPFIEELFVRNFLMRIIINRDWEKVKIGTYTLSSFIITTLFFGFSHNRWLVGLITGALLNLLLYKRKNIESCIEAHLFANLLLACYIIYTQSWFFW